MVIENVPQIITKNGGYAKDRITEIFTERGYFVTNAILDASDYGVPQKRLRNFFIITKGNKFDLSRIVKSDAQITVRDAIGELYQFEGTSAEFRELHLAPDTPYRTYLRAKNNLVVNHDIHYPAEIQQKGYRMFRRVVIGGMSQKSYGKRIEQPTLEEKIAILRHING